MRREKKSLRISIILFVAVLGLSPAMIGAQGRVASQRIESDQASFRLVRAADELRNPWGMAFLPDGGILITERQGRLLFWRDGRLSTVSGLPEIYAAGQGGLLDIAVHPDFEKNRLVYFSYSVSESGGSATALYRARLEGTSLLGGEELYRLPRFTGTRVHFGSRIVFAPDGSLYMSIGDRGDRTRAQRLDDAAGSTLRFNDDGSIPEDNPFAGRRGALPEIYSYGHRNAQGMAVHPETGRIWQHEHGPRGGDEVNIVKPGANYGWPTVSFGKEYRGGSIGVGNEAPGIEPPLINWTPSIAPSGMSFYTGDLFPEWKGDLFVGALAGKHLRRLELSGERVIAQEILLSDEIGRIRDVRQGPDGHIWLLTDASNGGLYRLEP
ncbi:MAG: PQQ-dependent sugar dehydrogenase [Spirochaetota bacterium]|nr:PQQ-dependent sugar dehydrogenase [Spirochaetota bacterium]